MVSGNAKLPPLCKPASINLGNKYYVRLQESHAGPGCHLPVHCPAHGNTANLPNLGCLPQITLTSVRNSIMRHLPEPWTHPGEETKWQSAPFSQAYYTASIIEPRALAPSVDVTIRWLSALDHPTKIKHARLGYDNFYRIFLAYGKSPPLWDPINDEDINLWAIFGGRLLQPLDIVRWEHSLCNAAYDTHKDIGNECQQLQSDIDVYFRREESRLTQNQSDRARANVVIYQAVDTANSTANHVVHLRNSIHHARSSYILATSALALARSVELSNDAPIHARPRPQSKTCTCFLGSQRRTRVALDNAKNLSLQRE